MININIVNYKDIINDPDLFCDLKNLTNSGDTLARFGSAMLDGLNGVYPLHYAVVIKLDDNVIGWGSIIQTGKVCSGHTFVHPDFRGNGLGSVIVESMLDLNKNLYFASTDKKSKDLYSKFVPHKRIA